MKKLSLILMSVLTIAMGSVLASCSFKSPQASFSQSEVLLSVNESINLQDYLSVSGVEKTDISFQPSNTSILQVQGDSALAISSGRTNIYATYQNNSLASMQVVVKKQFDSPKNFSLDESGVLTWDVVSGFFENEQNPTLAQSYVVEGTCTTFQPDSPDQEVEVLNINEVTNTNSITLSNYGTYALTVTAQGNGYFDNSEPSQVPTLYFGYMDRLSADDLIWDAERGTLSWSAIAGAEYQVRMDGVLLDDRQSTLSKDLSSFFSVAQAGTHEVSVLVFDNAGEKIARESDVIEIEKLAAPTAQYVYSQTAGGLVQIETAEGVEKYDIILRDEENQEDYTISFEEFSGESYTNLNGLASGVYQASVVAKNESGLFYQSNETVVGRIFKMPSLNFVGRGENELDGATFKAQVSTTSSLLNGDILVTGLGDNVVLDGLDADELSKDIEIAINQSGSFDLSVYAMARSEFNQLSGQDVLVINSDVSQVLHITKAEAFASEITHSYGDNSSVLTFDVVNNADTYTLEIWNGTDFEEVSQGEYDASVQGQTVTITLTNKIENLFEPVLVEDDMVFRLRVVAKTADDLTAIGSSKLKDLTLLSAPISADSGDSTDKTYVWNEVENASGYQLQIYQIDKGTYQANQSEINVDISSLSPVEREAQSASYTFENVGYFYVRIFATSGDVNQFISSTEYMQDVFYIAEKLVNGAVEFGFDQQYVNHSGFTASSGYFVRVENVPNITSYQLTVGSANDDIFAISEGDTNIYLLSENFAQGNTEISITVVGHADDEMIYVATDPTVLTVERLGQVTFEDLDIDQLTSRVTLKQKDGVTGGRIWYNDGNVSDRDDAYPSLNISSLNDFSLLFTLYGTKLNEEGIYQATDDKIYLDSMESTLQFARLQAPTNFRYYDGKLTFDHDAISIADYYVLDLNCITPNGDNLLTIRLDDTVIVQYEGQEIQLAVGSDVVSYSGTAITINLDTLVEQLKANEQISGVYNQSTEIDFSVYAYVIENDSSVIYLSSPYASVYGNSASTSLKVEKMITPQIEFAYSDTDYTLSWQAVETEETVASETSYQVFLDDEPFGSSIVSGLSYNFANTSFNLSTYYTFYIKAENPYYLESANSNTITIYRLSRIPRVTLTADGNLSYEIATAERDFVENVKVDALLSTSSNTSGLVEITGSGNYTFTVIGRTIENENSATHYLDSAPSTWTLTEMDTLAPSDNNVTFSNNLLSWNAFGANAGIGSLSYLVIFRDTTGKTVTYNTTDTTLNLQDNTELYQSISALAAGDIEIGVSAYLLGNGTYTVVAGGTVYYSLDVELLNGNTENHHYLYTSDQTVTKLATPNVTKVEFVYSGLENAQFPDIQVSFVGNYGNSGRFSIYLNDSDFPIMTTNIAQSDGTYTFTLTREYYNNTIQPGQTLTVKIMALSDTAIPSSSGIVEITRVVDLQSVAFKENEDKFTQNLVLTFNPDNLDFSQGGVNLQISYQPASGEQQTEYRHVDVNSVSESLTYDMSEFFEEYLADGGTIQISAYIASFADDENKIYYLPAPTLVTSQTYNVLKQVEQVTHSDGGFVIDSSLNNANTVYVVQYGASRFEVPADRNGEFYFEFPNSWANGSYELEIFASENDYINSVINVVSFQLNRIASVDVVTMERDVDNMATVTLSWDEIANSDGYILKMFAKTDTEHSAPLYVFNSADYDAEHGTQGASDGKVVYTLEQIFGRNFEDLIAYDKLTAFDLMSDIEVVFDLVTIGGSGYNNSFALTFNATVKGNPVQTTDIIVDEFGRIAFTSVAGTSYMYRLVDSTGDTELQGWQVIEATSASTTLNVSSEIATGVLFNVEIIVVGSAIESPATSADFDFVLDSMPLTTVGNDLTFIVNESIVDVGYNENIPSLLAFTMISNSFTKLYVGLEENAIMSGDVFGFVPAYFSDADTDMQSIHSYSLGEIINGLIEQGCDINLNDNFKLYFWSYRTSASITGSYVISKAYEFTFALTSENSFKEIMKVGDLGEDSVYPEDYANTFAVFNNNDSADLQTIGIFVRITHIADDNAGDFTSIKFRSSQQMTGHAYFEGQNVYVINLTSMFEEEDLFTMSGTFEVAFSRLQVQSSDDKIILTDWFEGGDENSFTFEKLPEVQNLRLSAGSLYWDISGEKTDKYYVYFIIDLNGNILGERYNYFATASSSFNASDFVGTENQYYIAVQSISENPFLLPSNRVFIVDVAEGSNEPVLVRKNQVTSPIKLQDGKLYIDWSEDGDFYRELTGDGSFEDIAKTITSEMFSSPFTFSLQQLVDDNITMRLRFTPLTSGNEGMRKIFDVNAKYLLASLLDFGTENDYDIEGRLNEIYTNASDSSTRNLIGEFRENIVNRGSFGVANAQVLFDDIFEALQTGSYRMEYCLIGSNVTLSSSWYEFKNNNGENVIYVNGEPSVSARKVENPTDISINSYQVLVRKSQIYDYVGGSYSLMDAQGYNMVVYDDAGNRFVFAITKGITNWSLTLLDEDVEGSVSVYETDASGTTTENGPYLMFYLNQNNGNSIMGRYNSVVQSGHTYKMQIYAVGTNFSTSSKSEFFSLTLLGFNDTFAINNGQFVWGSVNNRKTSVIYKKNTSSQEEVTEIDGTMATSTFSLNGLGNGLYDYIKFVLFGEVRAQSIFVDSEIYIVENVYKLASPTLNNNYGYIGIDDSANISMLGIDSPDHSASICYSDGSLYNYVLYNSDENETIYFSDQNSASEIVYYEAGTTGMDVTHPDYEYKSTEEVAREFHVVSLGTTAGFEIEDDESAYYLKHIYCLDIETGEKSDKSVAVRSEVATIHASMLDTLSNVWIENGILHWDDVTGKAGDEPMTIPSTDRADIIYKVTVVQYVPSSTEGGETETNVGQEYYYYTTENFFDFTIINEDQIVVTDDTSYLKATVQALALNVTDTLPTGAYVSLVEGGYAYGNLQYADSDIYILMGNGAILRQIDRLAPVDEGSLQVRDGSLYWTYTTTNSITDEDMFFQQYDFIVMDEDGNEVSGQLVVDAIYQQQETSTNVFSIRFVEDAGAMQDGTQVLTVYTTQGRQNDDVIIKSFGRTIEVTKLRTITSDDYTITSQGGLETLDMSAYFTDNNSNTVRININIVSHGEPVEEREIEFNISQYKLYILRSEDDVKLISSYPEFYVTQYIVISEDQIAQITFEVENLMIANTIYSDVSEQFTLQRSNWGADSKIVWDEENQVFTWNYGGYYSFNSSPEADKVSEGNVLTEQVTLYTDSQMQESADIILEAGTVVSVEDVQDGVATIMYESMIYYISESSYEWQRFVVETETLDSSTMFTVVANEGENTLIEVGGDRYLVATSAIIQPVYIIEVTYGAEPNQIVRTYTTTETQFAPSIITDQIRISVSVKLGDTNIQSQELVYTSDEGTDFVAFNLFESGDGTSENPYRIVNEEQFKNIAKRMKKDNVLVNYVENGREVNEEEQYYFLIESDLVLSENGNTETYINGILFAGEFEGIIEGNGSTITYISSGVAPLSQDVLVAEGHVLGPSTETSTTYRYGSSLFETLASGSAISNLQINASFLSSNNSYIPHHSLIASLAITNGGRLDNINLVGFSSNFIGRSTPGTRVIMIYSGIVSRNTGSVARISNSTVSTDMTINDGNQAQLIFVSGIAFINYATIEDCSVGGDSETHNIMYVTFQERTGTAQVAGIVNTNTTAGTIRNCANYFNISVECTQAGNSMAVYIAGVADYGRGTLESVANYGTLNTRNISENNLHQGDVSI